MRIRRVLASISLVSGLVLFGEGVWIQGKAVVAQLLLESAWSASVVTGKPVKPWPYADHWPIAEISFPLHKSSFIVLEGDSGSSLAFAPGWSRQGVRPDEKGLKVISAHRDTHFKVLGHVEVGHPIQLSTRAHERIRYQVTSMRVVDTSKDQIWIDKESEGLLLVTCYPFDAIQSGGPLRLVVEATRQVDQDDFI